VIDDRARAIEVLCSDELADMVELVAWSSEPGVYHARALDGEVTFRRLAGSAGTRPAFETTEVVGRDLLADGDPTRFAPLAEELAHLCPTRKENSYPYAHEHIAQVFDHPCAPDLCVLHTAAHRWEEHAGEHASLGVVQARAPFIVSGKGVRHDGMVERHCRLVDVAPTILALLGAPAGRGIGPSGEEEDGLHLVRQDGEALVDLLDPAGVPELVIGFLLDGANANVLYAAAAEGRAPNVARLIAEGTAFRYGAFASLPTVTLANHTTILTGCHPGHHGVLHNAWYDRALGQQVITESPTTWQEAMRWLAPGVETIHGAVKRWRPEAISISVNEPADVAADYSTFELFRSGEAARLMPDLSQGTPAYTSEQYFRESAAYQFASWADTVSVGQATSILAGQHLDVEYELPTFMWVTTSVTDAAFHEGGPHSEIAAAALADADARVGAVLDAVEQRGAADSVAYVLVADHGMEQNSPDVTGDWGDALSAAGIKFRDEASGFVYFNV
jgi:phosphonoacetate hydrolase